MRLEDLDFNYPNELIATQPHRPSRVMWVENAVPMELTWPQFLDKFEPGDLLIMNNTKVIPSRVFAQVNGSDFEILFLKKEDEDGYLWQVLCPASRLKSGQVIQLPMTIQGKIVKTGRPQVMQFTEAISDDYLFSVGEMPLPPYIQKARGTRRSRPEDHQWYQTVFAKVLGSRAAPTASLHFSDNDLLHLRQKGVQLEEVTLHVGLGTFLSIESTNPLDHPIHREEFHVSEETSRRIFEARKQGHRIWVLGTTAVRAVESLAQGISQGTTDLFLKPGAEFKLTDILLTNFHQPRSTLLLLVAAFSDLKTVLSCYHWAIERKFRLFSYGDLTAWVKP